MRPASACAPRPVPTARARCCSCSAPTACLRVSTIGVEAVQRGLLGLVLLLRLRRTPVASASRSRPLRSLVSDFAALIGLQQLPIEIVDARALDLGRLRRWGEGDTPAVRIPLRLPFAKLRSASRVLPAGPGRRPAAPPFGARLRRSNRGPCRGASSPAMWSPSSASASGFVVARFAALAHFALVCDLLLDAGHLAADSVNSACTLPSASPAALAPPRPVSISRSASRCSATCSSMPSSALRQLRRMRALNRSLRFAKAEKKERLQLGFLNLLLGIFQLLPALGLYGLGAAGARAACRLRRARRARGRGSRWRRLDARFGFLAALLVLRDAGRLFEMIAQLFRRRFDDLADHALLDDRVAARTKAGAEEHVGDIAASAANAVVGRSRDCGRRD